MADLLEHSRRWRERPQEQRQPWRRVDFTTPGFIHPDQEEPESE